MLKDGGAYRCGDVGITTINDGESAEVPPGLVSRYVLPIVDHPQPLTFVTKS